MPTLNITFAEADTLTVPLTFPAQFAGNTLQLTTASLSQAELDTQVSGQDIIILNKRCVTSAVLEHNPKLKLVVLTATGFDRQPLDELKARGVRLCNAVDYGYQAVAEHTFMLMLNLFKNTPAYTQAVQTGKWSASPNFSYLERPLFELRGKTLTIIGKGKSGQAFAQQAAAFGMTVIFAEHKHATTCRAGYVPFEQALAWADVVSLHCVLNADTQQLIDAEVLASMKPTAYLINTARGGLVSDIAIAQALQQQRLAGYAADVLSVEPPPADHPLLNLDLPNLIITPHVAWATQEAQQRLVAETQQNVYQFLQGHPQNVVV